MFACSSRASNIAAEGLAPGLIYPQGNLSCLVRTHRLVKSVTVTEKWCDEVSDGHEAVYCTDLAVITERGTRKRKIPRKEFGLMTDQSTAISVLREVKEVRAVGVKRESEALNTR